MSVYKPMNRAQVPAETLLPVANTVLEVTSIYDSYIKKVDAYISRISDNRNSDGDPQVSERVNELRSCRTRLAEANRGLRRHGKRIGKLAKQPILGNVLTELAAVIHEEAPGSATHEQLLVAQRAVEDALAGVAIPKPTDNG